MKRLVIISFLFLLAFSSAGYSADLDSFYENFSTDLDTGFFSTVEYFTGFDVVGGKQIFNATLVSESAEKFAFTYTKQNVSESDFIVSVFINVSENNLTTDAWWESGLMLHNASNGVNIDSDVVCSLGNDTAAEGNLYFYNETFEGNAKSSVFTEQSGDLTLRYNSTSDVYNCTYGDLTLSSGVTGLADNFSVGIFGAVGADSSGTANLNVSFAEFQFTTGAMRHELADFYEEVWDGSLYDLKWAEYHSDFGIHSRLAGGSHYILQSNYSDDLASLAGIYTNHNTPVDLDNFTAYAYFNVSNSSVVPELGGETFTGIILTDSDSDMKSYGGVGCGVQSYRGTENMTSYISLINNSGNYSMEQETTTTVANYYPGGTERTIDLESDNVGFGVYLTYNNATGNITCKVENDTGDSSTVEGPVGTNFFGGMQVGLFGGHFAQSYQTLSSNMTTSIGVFNYSTFYVNLSYTEDVGGEECSEDCGGDDGNLSSFYDGFEYGLNWDSYVNVTTNDDFINVSDGVLRLNASSDTVLAGNRTLIGTNDNITNESFIATVWMNLTDTSSTFGTAAALTNPFPMAYGLFSLADEITMQDVQCGVAYMNVTGYSASDLYLLLINNSGNSAEVALINQSYGVLSFEYNASAGTYDCGFANDTLSTTVDEISTDMKLMLINYARDANSSVFFDNLTYFVYDNFIDDFYEDFAVVDATFLSFFDGSECGGGNMSCSESGDGRIRLNLSYTDGNYYEGGNDGWDMISTQSVISDYSFNSTVEINYTHLTNLNDTNEIMQGLLLGNDDQFVMCVVDSLNDSETDLDGDYLLLVAMLDGENMFIQNTSLTIAGDWVNGTVGLAYDNSTENLTCSFGDESLSLNAFPKYLSYPSFAIASDLVYNATGSGEIEMFFDNWQYNITIEEEEVNYLEAFTQTFAGTEFNNSFYYNFTESGVSIVQDEFLNITVTKPDGEAFGIIGGNTSNYGQINTSSSFYFVMEVNLTNLSEIDGKTAFAFWLAEDLDGDSLAQCEFSKNLTGSYLSNDTGDDNSPIEAIDNTLGEFIFQYNSTTTNYTCSMGGGNLTFEITSSLSETYSLVMAAVAINATTYVAVDDLVFGYGEYEAEVEDVAPSSLAQNEPEEGYYNDTSSSETITFNCSAADDQNLANISLYLTNSSNSSFAINQTTTVTGTVNNSEWGVALGVGNYTWGCVATDNASQTTWTANRSLYMNYTVEEEEEEEDDPAVTTGSGSGGGGGTRVEDIEEDLVFDGIKIIDGIKAEGDVEEEEVVEGGIFESGFIESLREIRAHWFFELMSILFFFF
jgi:hypothetical protein